MNILWALQLHCCVASVFSWGAPAVEPTPAPPVSLLAERVPLDGSAVRVAIVAAAHQRRSIVERLVAGAHDALRELKVKRENVAIIPAHGSYELPLATKRVLETGQFDVAISIGVLVKGETTHFERISDAVARGLMEVQLQIGVPVIYGVLTCLDEAQAIDRSTDGPRTSNLGRTWAEAAVHTAQRTHTFNVLPNAEPSELRSL